MFNMHLHVPVFNSAVHTNLEDYVTWVEIFDIGINKIL